MKNTDSHNRSFLRLFIGELGRFLIFTALILLVLLIYVLFGTGAFTASSQAKLKTEIEKIIPSPKIPVSKKSFKVVPINLPTSTSSNPQQGSPIAEINIPAIGLQMVVVEGTQTGDLRLGPGHYQGTSLPGMAGNVAIAGHRTTYLHPFYNLAELKGGDPIFLTSTIGTLEYLVTNIDVREPYDITILRQFGDNRLTLTTCNPKYSAATRLVVVAHLLGIVEVVNSNTPSSSSKPNAPKTSPNSGGSLKNAKSLLAGSTSSTSPEIGWGVLLFFDYLLFRLSMRHIKGWKKLLAALVTFGVLMLLILPFCAAVAAALPASF
ncbi:MAG: class E sortase [Acidimicrobiales bacterium]|nr:class E sortase [Acidimicrobiales bacterium]